MGGFLVIVFVIDMITFKVLEMRSALLIFMGDG